MLFAELLFMLFAGHALADFVLQPDAMGYGKNRNDKIHDRESSLFPVWYYWLTAHAMTHGGVVFLITNSLVLAIIEVVAHWFIDYAKCEGWIGMHQDQAMHLGCKVVYALLIFSPGFASIG